MPFDVQVFVQGAANAWVSETKLSMQAELVANGVRDAVVCMLRDTSDARRTSGNAVVRCETSADASTVRALFAPPAQAEEKTRRSGFLGPSGCRKVAFEAGEAVASKRTGAASGTAVAQAQPLKKKVEVQSGEWVLVQRKQKTGPPPSPPLPAFHEARKGKAASPRAAPAEVRSAASDPICQVVCPEQGTLSPMLKRRYVNCKCAFCGLIGHPVSHDKQTTCPKLLKLRCAACGGQGHSAKFCPTKTPAKTPAKRQSVFWASSGGAD